MLKFRKLRYYFRTHPFLVLFFASWGIYFYSIWRNMIVLRSDGLYAGHPYVWADWGFHLSLISSFAYKPIALWFASYPVFSGEKVTYPFVTNLISAILIRIGASLESSVLLPSFLFSLLALVFLFVLYQKVLSSEKQSLFAALLFLFSGGLGAFRLFGTLGVKKVLFDGAIVTTQVPDLHIETNNILSSMMIPQRAFLLGLPIGLAILASLVQVFLFSKKIEKIQRSWLVGAGFCAGLLPIIHTHTFIVIVLFSLYLFVFRFRRFFSWCWYGVPAVIVSVIVYMHFLHGNVDGGKFFSLHLGWLAPAGVFSWMWFWIQNWGFFLFCAIGGTLYTFLKRKRAHAIFFGFFWILFVLANVVSFQLQVWDNTKIFAWAYIGLAPAAVAGLHVLWQWKGKFGKIAAILLFSLSVCSGAIDVSHNLDTEKKTFRMLSSEELEIGHWVRQNTPPDSVFLTPEMVENPIAMNGARSVVMGYSGWVFSYGLSYQERQIDLRDVFETQTKNASEVAHKYDATYIYVPISSALELPNLQPVFENSAGKVFSLQSK